MHACAPALPAFPPGPPPAPQGVFAGGVESASELVRRGEAAPTEFMLLAGYSGWGPWQLQQELRAGTWLPVAASQAVIMDVLKGAPPPLPSPGPGVLVQRC